MIETPDVDPRLYLTYDDSIARFESSRGIQVRPDFKKAIEALWTKRVEDFYMSLRENVKLIELDDGEYRDAVPVAQEHEIMADAVAAWREQTLANMQSEVDAVDSLAAIFVPCKED